jgi:uncharacterized protein (UPF0264 family)
MRLLVSVRSVAEAETALIAGADLIDVKEPAHGSLGRADDDTIAGVLDVVRQRRPVSAALGELAQQEALPSMHGLRFVKWGLADCADTRWEPDLENSGRKLRQRDSQCEPVAVAYADWQRAAAPKPDQVVRFVINKGWQVLLLDTWKKDGATLFDWLPPASLHVLLEDCRASNVRVALAGSLGFDHLTIVRDLEPDWLAVRGAVCRRGQRANAIDPARVTRLAKTLHQVAIPAD